MTNALAQNIDQNQTSNAIDIMMQAVSSSSQTNSKEQSGFSNIINNLESRTQKAQNNFDKQAKVTNVSSINKKALEKKETVDTKKIEKNIQTTKTVSREIERSPKKIQPKETTNVSLDKKPTTEENKTLESCNTQTVSNKKEIETTKETENLSDINNSSPVETSPVFSSESEVNTNEETKTEIESALEEIELNVEQLINSIPVISEEVKVEIKDLNTALENVENIEDVEKIINKIENIASNLDNSTLSQEQKTEITDALDKIKTLLKDAKKVIEQPKKFENLINELKEQISNLIENKEININETTDATLKSEIKIETVQPKEELKLNNETTKEIVDEIKTVIKEIKDTISDLNNEKSSEFNKKLSETLEKLESLDEIQNSNKEIDFKKDLTDSLKNLKNLLEKSFNAAEVEIEKEAVEYSLNNENKIFETLEKLSSNDFKNIDLKNEKTVKEIVNILDNLNQEAEKQELSNEIKVEIKDLIEKINQKEISNDDLAQAVDVLADDIKTETQKVQSENFEISEVPDISKEPIKTQTNSNQNFNQNQNQQKLETSETQELKVDLADFSENDVNFDEVKLQANVSKNVEVKNTDAKNIEQNLQKTIAINEMLDEMMVEVDIKTIPSQSGALSVTDEIAKLAMGESNSLNSIGSTSGSVTYDAVGTNAVIKNIANLTKTTQTQNLNTPSMEDVLNQVANKVTQLKDTNTQKLTMVLRPNDLGRLSIELTSNQQGLTTQIMAQNEDVRAYIERNIDSLRQQLSDAGVNVNSIQIKTAGSENSTTYDGNQNLAKNFEQENQNQRNNKNEQNHQQNNDNKDAKEILASISNYDMSFAKDFSSVLSKSLNYNLN